jgi:TetR/AcrR family transcriptional regulator
VSDRESSDAPGGEERLGREEKKALFRQRILEAAREVFFRDGFMAANLDEVAQIADVAKGTLYRYFDNKGELYVAVLSHNGEIFERKMREAAEQGRSPLEQLRSVGRFYFDHWTQNREYFQIFWALENPSVIGELPPGVVQEVTRLWENCLSILADVIQRGVREGVFADCDSWEVANILWTVANGLIQTEHVAPRRRLRRRQLDQVFADMVEIFLRGLAHPA